MGTRQVNLYAHCDHIRDNNVQIIELNDENTLQLFCLLSSLEQRKITFLERNSQHICR